MAATTAAPIDRASETLTADAIEERELSAFSGATGGPFGHARAALAEALRTEGWLRMSDPRPSLCSFVEQEDVRHEQAF